MLAGAIGVVIARNPVHAALMLVMTLFGIAVLFVLQRADFLAVVQVIVYAGAIVVLFLFVIMFLGVDRRRTSPPSRCGASAAGRRPGGPGPGRRARCSGQVSHWTTGQAQGRRASATGAPPTST